MLNKYNNEFEEMRQRIIGDRERPLDVVKDYLPFFEEDGIGTLGIMSYLSEYVRERSDYGRRKN